MTMKSSFHFLPPAALVMLLASGCCDPGVSDGTENKALVQGQARPGAIAVGASTIYWINEGDGSVQSAAKADGRTRVVAPPGAGAVALAADETAVYWATGDSLQSSTSALATDQHGLVQAIAVDEASVYWSIVGADGNGSILRVAKSGGAVETLASGQHVLGGLAVDAGFVYWATAPAETTGAVRRVPKSGGLVIDLAPVDAAPLALALDGEGVDWIEDARAGMPAHLFRVPTGGGEVATLASGDLGRTLAADASGIYVSLAGELARVALEGGQPAALGADGADPVNRIALGDSTVYWTVRGYGELDGKVMELLQ